MCSCTPVWPTSSGKTRSLMLTSATGASTVSVSTGNKNLILSVSYQVAFNPVAPLTHQCWSLRWDEERANTVLNQMAFLSLLTCLCDWSLFSRDLCSLGANFIIGTNLILSFPCGLFLWGLTERKGKKTCHCTATSQGSTRDKKNCPCTESWGKTHCWTHHHHH